MQKAAPTDQELHPLIVQRWSPYWFDERPIEAADLTALLEAARWAPSAYNEQPWVFMVATRERTEPFARMVSCLVEGNRTWARSAAVLLLGITRRVHAANGKPNPVCEHDLGIAAATLSVEATARGISVHQMSGIIPDRIRELYAVPEEFTPLTALALGYCARPEQVPERYRDRQLRRRERKPLDSFVFGDTWQAVADVVRR